MKKKAELVPGLGERIQKSRVSAKLTQAELAEKIDVSPQYISDLERSIVGASLNTLIGICKVLSVSSDYLLFGYDKESIEPLDTMIKLNALPEKERLLAEKMVDFMLESSKNSNSKSS